MKLKTLFTVGFMTLAAGLLPAGLEAATSTPAVPINASAFSAGAAVQLAPVVVVERRRRRGYYQRRSRTVRRVYYRNGVRRVVVRRVYY